MGISGQKLKLSTIVGLQNPETTRKLMMASRRERDVPAEVDEVRIMLIHEDALLRENHALQRFFVTTMNFIAAAMASPSGA